MLDLNDEKLAGGSLRQSTKAALSAEEILHGGFQVGGLKFRPHSRREEQFGVGAFPQHEVAQTSLAPGSN
jgi:hypothetical protein